MMMMTAWWPLTMQVREKTTEEREAEEAAAEAEDEAQVDFRFILIFLDNLTFYSGKLQRVQQLQADDRTYATRGECG